MASQTTPRVVRGDQLVRFFAITFVFSWLIWLLPALESTGSLELPAAVGLLSFLAPFGPGVAAFWLVRRERDDGVGELWRRGWRSNFDKKWLIPALGLGPAIAGATLGIVVASGETVDWEAAVPPLMIVPLFTLIYLTNALPEEYGWRGYALDPLQRRFTAVGASLVLGLIWGLWHLPLAFIEGSTQSAIPFPEFVLQTMVLAVVYTWLHNNTGGSVLIAALFHASANISAAVVPTWTTRFGRWTNFVLMCGVVSVIVGRYGWRRLARSSTWT